MTNYYLIKGNKRRFFKEVKDGIFHVDSITWKEEMMKRHSVNLWTPVSAMVFTKALTDYTISGLVAKGYTLTVKERGNK